VLVVEIAEISLAVDRAHKSGLYARAGIADCWIVNLPDGVLEVYREPAPSTTARSGAEYRAVQRFTSGATVSPLGAPTARIAVAGLLAPA